MVENPLFSQHILDSFPLARYIRATVPERIHHIVVVGLLAALSPSQSGCASDEPTYVQVNEAADCIPVRVTSAGDCSEEEAAVAADVTCCGGADIGDVTVTPGCGALGDEFEVVVTLGSESDEIDLSDVARVTVSVPNEGTELTELDLEQSDLQQNLWTISLGAGETGGTDRTDELCVAVWEVQEESDTQ